MIHRIGSAQIRLFVTLCLMFLAALLSRPQSAALALLFALLLWLASDIPWFVLRKRLLAVNAFLLFVWIFTPFSTPGRTCAVFLGFPITQEGLLLSLLVTLKCNAVFLFFCAGMGSADIGTLARAMTALHFPNKLVTLLMLTAQQLSGFSQVRKTLAEAAALRGFHPRNNLKTYRTYGAMLGILILQALRKSAFMREALLLKNFHGLWPRHHIVASTLLERFLAGLLALCSLLLLFLDRS